MDSRTGVRRENTAVEADSRTLGAGAEGTPAVLHPDTWVEEGIHTVLAVVLHHDDVAARLVLRVVVLLEHHPPRVEVHHRLLRVRVLQR